MTAFADRMRAVATVLPAEPAARVTMDPWLEGPLRPGVVALDGTILRQSHDLRADQAQLHLVNAWARAVRLGEWMLIVGSSKTRDGPPTPHRGVQLRWPGSDATWSG